MTVVNRCNNEFNFLFTLNLIPNFMVDATILEHEWKSWNAKSSFESDTTQTILNVIARWKLTAWKKSTAMKCAVEKRAKVMAETEARKNSELNRNWEPVESATFTQSSSAVGKKHSGNVAAMNKWQWKKSANFPLFSESLCWSTIFTTVAVPAAILDCAREGNYIIVARKKADPVSPSIKCFDFSLFSPSFHFPFRPRRPWANQMMCGKIPAKGKIVDSCVDHKISYFCNINLIFLLTCSADSVIYGAKSCFFSCSAAASGPVKSFPTREFT